MEKVSNNLFRGPRPKSMYSLRVLGIKHIINLQSGAYETLYDDQYEKDHASDHQMTEHEIPLSDVMIPDQGKVFQALNIMRGAVLRGERVFVHCKHGVDRTGYVIAAYRMMFEELSYERAVAEMYAKGFHKFPYFYWVKSLKRYSGQRS